MIDSTEDWDLQTPISPPVTSLEGAMVIFTACTSVQQAAKNEIILGEVRQTLCDTHAPKMSEALLSDREVSAHTDTNIVLFAQIVALQQELERTKAKNVKFKEKVVEQSSSSTSVNNQLILLKEEIQNIKTSLVPKLNSIQTSQLHSASDITSLTDSQLHISDNVKELSSMYAKMDLLHNIVLEIVTVVSHRFSKI